MHRPNRFDLIKPLARFMLRYLTAGESHGKAIVALIDGFPAGLTVDTGPIDVELRRRQGGYGRAGDSGLKPTRSKFCQAFGRTSRWAARSRWK